MQHLLKIEKKILIFSDAEKFMFSKAYSLSIKSAKYIWAEIDLFKVS